ncbi:MAG: universal stress protein [Rhodospirillales bacterium]|nr:universal stress protein [Rhodospirillales bacterium]
MTLRYLLVHLDKSEASGIRADVAIALAKRFGARLAALYAVCDPDVPSAASRDRYVFVERAAGKAEAAFRVHAAASGIDLEWQSDIGSSDVQVSRAVVMRSREADLVVLGQIDPSSADGSVPPTLIDDTVLHAGRPVLVVPFAGHFAAFGRHAVIAWNGSREATRAVHDALPLLAVADQVTVLALTPVATMRDDVEHSPPDGIVRHLIEHGVRAREDRLTFDPSTIHPAERLLSYLVDVGGDLLIMGAPGQQQSRAAAKKSVAGRILTQATVPVLLSY